MHCPAAVALIAPLAVLCAALLLPSAEPEVPPIDGAPATPEADDPPADPAAPSAEPAVPTAPPSGTRVVRSHDISFLTERVEDFPARIRPSAGGLLLEDLYYPAPSEAPPQMAFAAEEEAPPGTRILPEDLVRLIRQNVAEDSWANERNSIDVRGHELVVVQTSEVQDAIARLLAGLRARRARMFVVDVAMIPAEVVEGEPPPWPDAGALERLSQKAGAEGTRVSLTIYNEQTASAFSGKRRTTLIDTEVNQTGVIPVANPVVTDLPLGVTVEAEPVAAADGSLVRLRLSATRLEEAGPASKQESLFSEIESVPLREETIETVLLLRPGRTALAGIVEDGDDAVAGSDVGRDAKDVGKDAKDVGKEGRDVGKVAKDVKGVQAPAAAAGPSHRRFAVLARARRTDLQAAPPVATADPEEFQLRTYDLALAFDTLLGSPLLTPELLVEVLKADVEPEAWKDERASADLSGGRTLRVVARDATHRAVKTWADAIVARRARTALIEVQAHDGPADAVLRLKASAGGELELPAGWDATDDGKALRRTLRAVVSGALGSTVRARGFEARTFVRGVSSVSGGTGFSILVTPDPEVGSAGNGFRLEATATALLAPGRYELQVSLHRARTAFDRKATILAPAELGPARAPLVPFVPAGDDGSPVPAPPRGSWVLLPCILDLPDQSRLSLVTSAPVPEGRTVILRISPSEPGRCSMVTAKLVVDEERREP